MSLIILYNIEFTQIKKYKYKNNNKYNTNHKQNKN